MSDNFQGETTAQHLEITVQGHNIVCVFNLLTFCQLVARLNQLFKVDGFSELVKLADHTPSDDTFELDLPHELCQRVGELMLQCVQNGYINHPDMLRLLAVLAATEPTKTHVTLMI